MESTIVNTILIALAIMVLQVFLVMIIFNKVIIKKFPSSNIQELSFWDALAICVFISLLSTPCYIKNYVNLV
jgi:hypothetical protein